MHKTVNMGELYDGMTVQLKQDHTDAFNDRVEAMAEEMRKDQDAEEQRELLEQKKDAIVEAGMTPIDEPVSNQRNPSISLAEEYKDIDYVQLGFDHEGDTDDVVEAFNENV